MSHFLLMEDKMEKKKICVLGAGLMGAGIASTEDIDQAMVLGVNHPMKPLALADLIGLDTLLMVQENLYKEFGTQNADPVRFSARWSAPAN
jgi:3-hydroxyacyl-CoA dehydrogenase